MRTRKTNTRNYKQTISVTFQWSRAYSFRIDTAITVVLKSTQLLKATLPDTMQVYEQILELHLPKFPHELIPVPQLFAAVTCPDSNSSTNHRF